jgi:hypothetical protein
MIANIGQDLLLDDIKKVHVQDTNYINMVAMVGAIDENGLVTDTKWVSWGRLTRLNDQVSETICECGEYWEDGKWSGFFFNDNCPICLGSGKPKIKNKESNSL